MSSRTRNARSKALQDAGGTSTGSNNESNPSDATAAAAEPDQSAIAPIITGRHIWAARRATSAPPGSPTPPLVPYEDLPFPKSDRAQLPPCTVRWQFVGRFSLNREEKIACGSFRIQVRSYFAKHGITNATITVTFPRGVGRGRFVEVIVPAAHLQFVKDGPLVFNGEPLRRMFVGPALERTSLVFEVLGFPIANALKETGRCIAQALKECVQVHDVWVAQISYADDPAPPEDTNRLHLLVTVPPGSDGGMDPTKQHAIPGFLRIGKHEC